MTFENEEYEPSPEAWVRNQVAEFEASDGQRANTLPGTDDKIVVITNRGAKSGKVRKTPLMRVERDGVYVAVASKGGAPDNPVWYHNFLAYPEVELQDGADRRRYRAELVTGEERADLWELCVQTWGTYAEYQQKTDREIPLFKLTPIPEQPA